MRILQVLLVFFLVNIHLAFAQDQKRADSLKLELESAFLSAEERMELLSQIANVETNIYQSIAYGKELIALAQEEDNSKYLMEGYFDLGNSYLRQAQYDKALKNFFDYQKLILQTDDMDQAGLIAMAIADVYAEIGDRKNADAYYKQAIDILRQHGSPVQLATVQANIADTYVIMGEYDKARPLLEESLPTFIDSVRTIEEAYVKGNLGLVYAATGQVDSLSYFDSALSTLKNNQDNYAISAFMVGMAEIISEQGNPEEALEFANEGLALAVAHGFKEQQSDANLILSKVYDALGDQKNALAHYQAYVAQLNDQQILGQEIVTLRREHDMAQSIAENEILVQKQRTDKIIKIATIIASVLLGFLAFGLFRRFRYIQKTKKIIEEEQNRSNDLLMNILPEKTASELKEHGKVKAQQFDSVTVMFTDFQGFTTQSEKLSPQELVENVDYYFSKFDAIIQKYGLEKIKTIGDSYMCAGGLPFPLKDHAVKCVQAAMEIISFVENTKADPDKPFANFEVRIGINSGPIIAGVVGTKKFAYDIWGDTVNVAARMEQRSKPGKINISEHTHELVAEHFKCTHRGKIEVKNKGKLMMYFVDGHAQPRSSSIRRRRKKQVGQQSTIS